MEKGVGKGKVLTKVTLAGDFPNGKKKRLYRNGAAAIQQVLRDLKKKKKKKTEGKHGKNFANSPMEAVLMELFCERKRNGSESGAPRQC